MTGPKRVALDGLTDRDREWVRRASRLGPRVGARVYLVGGAVRDLLLGRPVTDLDLVATGEVASLAGQLDPFPDSKLTRSRRFGTWSWLRADGSRLDLACGRREVYPFPGALPQIAPADLAEDLGRRDFSINAIALELDERRTGRLHDPLGGREDLAHRRIRVLHERSFLDDPTRIFRAIRFAGRLGFSLEPTTRRLLRRSIDAGGLGRLSPARLRREVRLLLDEPAPLAGVRLAEAYGLWSALHPRLSAGPTARRRLRSLGSALGRPDLPKELARLPRWTLLLGVLIEPLAPSAGEELLGRLAVDRTTRGMLFDVLVRTRNVRRRISRLTRPRASRVDAICGEAHPGTLAVAAAFGPRRTRLLIGRWLADWSRRKADVTGADLLNAGLSPGPGIARGLSAARRAKLDGRARERSEQLRIAIRSARRA